MPRTVISGRLYNSRRNLTPEQKSYLRGKRYHLEEKKAHGGEREASSDNQNLERTRERLATEFGVAPSTIQSAKT